MNGVAEDVYRMHTFWQSFALCGAREGQKVRIRYTPSAAPFICASCCNMQSCSHARRARLLLLLTHVWDVAAVCDVTDACERNLLGEGLAEAWQALADLAGQQGCGTPRVHVVLNHPLQGPVFFSKQQAERLSYLSWFWDPAAG